MKNEILPFSIFESKDADIGIDNKDEIIKKLNGVLSNQFVLFLKLWNFHWIVVGKKFKNTHEFFNELYDEFFEDIDLTAERIRALNGKPIGTLKDFIEEADIKEYSDKETPKASKMYEMILKDYETLIKQIREILEGELDNGTNKLLEDIIEKYEKTAWMLRSNIEEE